VPGLCDFFGPKFPEPQPLVFWRGSQIEELNLGLSGNFHETAMFIHGSQQEANSLITGGVIPIPPTGHQWGEFELLSPKQCPALLGWRDRSVLAGELSPQSVSIPLDDSPFGLQSSQLALEFGSGIFLISQLGLERLEVAPRTAAHSSDPQTEPEAGGHFNS